MCAISVDDNDILDSEESIHAHKLLCGLLFYVVAFLDKLLLFISVPLSDTWLRVHYDTSASQSSCWAVSYVPYNMTMVRCISKLCLKT